MHKAKSILVHPSSTKHLKKYLLLVVFNEIRSPPAPNNYLTMKCEHMLTCFVELDLERWKRLVSS